MYTQRLSIELRFEILSISLPPFSFFFWFPEERGGESGGGKERAGLTFGTPLLQTLLLCCGFGLYKLAMKWSFSGQKSLPL